MASKKSRAPRRREKSRRTAKDETRGSRPKRTRTGSSVISPRDERGTPYPGDFPNPLHRIIKGCF